MIDSTGLHHETQHPRSCISAKAAALCGALRALTAAAARAAPAALAAAAPAALLPGLLAAVRHHPRTDVRRGAVGCLAELLVKTGDRWVSPCNNGTANANSKQITF